MRRPDPAVPVKPRDLGNGLVCASFATAGAWLSLGGAHPEHGFVELNGLPRFDPSWRGDPAAVRRYRTLATQDRYAFLWLRCAGDVHVEESASATGPSIATRYRIGRPASDERPIVIGYHGRLDRHPYAEITDISPLPPLRTANRLRLNGSALRVEAPSLPATAIITVRLAGGHTAGWSRTGSGGAQMAVDWAGAEQILITVECSLTTPSTPQADRPSPRPARARRSAHGSEHYAATAVGLLRTPDPLRTAGSLQTAGSLRTPPGLKPRLDRIVDGTIDYILGCTALRVGESDVCIVTDHRLLPLSWTRDAYYQALVLLCAADREPQAALTVADHLRWLWYRSRDSRGSWMRSHLANGRVKDRGLQADQQLYPILELCDYRRATGGWPDPPDPGLLRHTDRAHVGAAWGAMIAQAWAGLPRHDLTGLLSSEENPADDLSALPYTLSTQILYWYTAVRLREWKTELSLGALALGAEARRVMAAVNEHFATSGPYGTQWAYESDLRGRRRLYNDANDLPTALAPLWGFCAPNEPLWAATMRFTFSDHNPACHTGAYGGLGSAHTPGTWPLGDVQQWVAACLLDQPQAADDAIRRLTTIAADDGLLPETYDPDTGAWQARHWFAWPSAALGAIYLNGASADAPWRLSAWARPADPAST